MELEFAHLVKEKCIRLGGKSLLDSDLDVLIDVLRESTVLETLYLWGNRITLVDGRLANALAHNRTVTALRLDHNRIGVEGARQLASVLKVNRTLQTLGLGINQIGHEGARCLAEALPMNNTLLKIYLSVNNIGDEGALSMATSLVSNTSLKVIYLQRNKISDVGATKFANTLEWNCNIENLSIKWNFISHHVDKKIRKLLGDPKRKHYRRLMALKDEQLERKNVEIEMKDMEIANIRNGIASRDGQIGCLEAALKAKEDEIAKMLLTTSRSSEGDGDQRSTSINNNNKRIRTMESNPCVGNGNDNSSTLDEQQYSHQQQVEKNTSRARLMSAMEEKGEVD